MPLENQETALEWLKRAKSNLALARQPRTKEIYLEDLCFEAQQAAEKALKAVLIAKEIPFRYVHDLAELLTLIASAGILIPDAVTKSAGLTEYAVAARYPGPYEPVTAEEFDQALSCAAAVVHWAEDLISPA
ncbi:HEPN domain-containing protein [Geoalkalibacter halelectricus]|uniref:HEPN domain-containing protein n=1 Tax=Geoalkalibacter halelectricus TaxID=2847045 RepID=UPI003D1CBE23